MRPVGVGIIGCGIRGRHGYEHFLASHSAVRLLALSHYPHSAPGLREGRSEADDRAYAERLGVSYYGEDFAAVLGREDIEIISLMVEPGQTAAYVERAAAAGKHLVVDKPLAGSVADGRRIVDSVNRHGVKCMVTFNERYAPPLRQLAAQLQAGTIGKLLSATVTFAFAGPLAGFTGNAAYRESFGGGEFANFGCYCADYLSWLTQAPVESVYGQRGSFFYEDYQAAGMDDLGQCVVRYASGVIGTLIAGRPRSAYAAPWITADLTGECGSLRATCHLPLLEVSGAQYRLQPYGSPGLAELCRDFVDCVLNDTPSPVPAEAGLASLEIVHAAYESARRGEVVRRGRL